MATIAFDSLSASKRLREAGMNERMADTVVEIVQQTASMPDISHLATKDDLGKFATRDDLKPFATKDDLKQFATKDDLKPFATKDDLKPFATKDDLKQFATKDDLKPFATKDDLKPFASKEDLKQLELATRADIVETKLTLRNEMAQLEVRLSEKIRMQGWSLLGGMAVLLAFYTAMAKLIA